MLVRFVQSAKAKLLIVVTPFGIVIPVRFVQSLKAYSPIIFMWSGIVTVVTSLFGIYFISVLSFILKFLYL